MKHQKLVISELERSIPFPNPASATSELMNSEGKNIKKPLYRRQQIMSEKIGDSGNFETVSCGDVIIGDLALLNKVLSKIVAAGWDPQVVLNARLVDECGVLQESYRPRDWIARLSFTKNCPPNDP